MNEIRPTRNNRPRMGTITETEPLGWQTVQDDEGQTHYLRNAAEGVGGPVLGERVLLRYMRAWGGSLWCASREPEPTEAEVLQRGVAEAQTALTDAQAALDRAIAAEAANKRRVAKVRREFRAVNR